MNKRKTNFASLRLQQDWSKLRNENFFLDGFTVQVDPPVQMHKCYSVNIFVTAPITIYNDKPYQVFSK